MKRILGHILLWLLLVVITCALLGIFHFAAGYGWLASVGIVALCYGITLLIMFWCAFTLHLIWWDHDFEKKYKDNCGARMKGGESDGNSST